MTKIDLVKDVVQNFTAQKDCMVRAIDASKTFFVSHQEDAEAFMRVPADEILHLKSGDSVYLKAYSNITLSILEFEAPTEG